MARARTATVMSTPREPASFQTICLACSIAGLGRQWLPNPRLQGRQTRVCGLMSALAYGADGADSGGSVSVHVASGGQEHTKDRGHRTHAGLTVDQNLQRNMTRIAEKVRPGEPSS